MNWTGWQRSKSAGDLPNMQYNDKVEGAWYHVLVSPASEPNPDANHVHIKWPFRKGQSYYDERKAIVCSVKIDGRRVHSRREMIQRINKAAGLNLNWT